MAKHHMMKPKKTKKVAYKMSSNHKKGNVVMMTSHSADKAHMKMMKGMM